VGNQILPAGAFSLHRWVVYAHNMHICGTPKGTAFVLHKSHTTDNSGIASGKMWKEKTKEEIYIGVFAEIKEGKWRSTVLKE
jgi:hypothetical protein